MALTQNQNLPNKPENAQEWTFKKLFGGGAVSAVSKVFTNPFDVLLGYLILVVGVAELIGRHISWYLWVLITLLLFIDLLERRRDTLTHGEPKKGKKK